MNVSIFLHLYKQNIDCVQDINSTIQTPTMQLIVNSEHKMPRLRRVGNIGRRSRSAVSSSNFRNRETDEENEQRLEDVRQRSTSSRRQYQQIYTASQRQQMSSRRRQQHMDDTHRPRDNLHNAAFEYDPNINYRQHKTVQIGSMNALCVHCNAKKFPNETPGMCCANGKVKLPALQSPPEPLNALISDRSPESTHFLKNIQSYNNCFQMTSFGATEILRDGYMPTFKVNSMEAKLHEKLTIATIKGKLLITNNI